jgi:hypothetical protein
VLARFQSYLSADVKSPHSSPPFSCRRGPSGVSLRVEDVGVTPERGGAIKVGGCPSLACCSRTGSERILDSEWPGILKFNLSFSPALMLRSDEGGTAK